MDKLTKLLGLLTPREREIIEQLLLKLLSGESSSLDIKKLIGAKDIYRLRKGLLRIIFKKENETVRILEISRRSEDTYKNY